MSRAIYSLLVAETGSIVMYDCQFVNKICRTLRLQYSLLAQYATKTPLDLNALDPAENPSLTIVDV